MMRVRITVALAFVLIPAIGGCSSQNAASKEPSLGVSREVDLTATAVAPVETDPRHVTSTKEPWQFGEHVGCLLCTPNYKIYTTIDNERILDRLPAFYELALDHYTKAIVKLPKPTEPLITFLFQTRSQWQAKTAEMLPDQANMFSNLGRGGFTTKGTAVLYYIDRRGFTRDTFAIAAHEGWHQYTQKTFRHQLPVWLEEGVATYMEGYRTDRETGLPIFNPLENYERREALRDAVRNDELIPLSELLTRSPQSFLNNSKDSLLTYYSQVWALTRFLVDGENGRYRPSLNALLTEAAEGRLVSRMLTSTVTAGARRLGGAASIRVGPAVVQEYFNRDLNEFEQQYRAYIDTLLPTRTR